MIGHSILLIILLTIVCVAVLCLILEEGNQLYSEQNNYTQPTNIADMIKSMQHPIMLWDVICLLPPWKQIIFWAALSLSFISTIFFVFITCVSQCF